MSNFLGTLHRWLFFGGGGNWTPVRMCETGASTGLAMRGGCRDPVAAPQASVPYSDKSPVDVSDTIHSKPWLATEAWPVQSGTVQLPCSRAYAARANWRLSSAVIVFVCSEDRQPHLQLKSTFTPVETGAPPIYIRENVYLKYIQIIYKCQENDSADSMFSPQNQSITLWTYPTPY